MRIFCNSIILAVVLFCFIPSLSAQYVSPSSIDLKNSVYTLPAVATEKTTEQPFQRRGFALYIAAKLGYTAPVITAVNTTKFNSSFLFGAAFGGIYRFQKPLALRLELEYLYRTKTRDSFPTSEGRTTLDSLLQTVLTNLYLDWYVTQQFYLYGSVGFGVGVLRFDTQTGTKPEGSHFTNEFAWQAGIGLAYLLTKHIAIDCNIRYIGYPSIHTINFDIKEIQHLGGLEALISVRYAF